MLLKGLGDTFVQSKRYKKEATKEGKNKIYLFPASAVYLSFFCQIRVWPLRQKGRKKAGGWRGARLDEE